MAICGFGVTSPSFRTNYRTVMYVIIMLSGSIFQWHTIITGDREMAMKGLTLAVLPLQGYCKFTSYLWKASEYAGMVQFLEKIYRQCEKTSVQGDEPGEFREVTVLRPWIGRYLNVMKFYGVMAVLTVFIFFSLPVYSILFLHKNEFMYPIFLPGVDTESMSGIISTWVYQLILILATSFGLLACDLMMVVLIMHSCAMADILCGKLQRMGEHLRGLQRWRLSNASRGGRPDADTRVFLHNCVRAHQEYVFFLGQLSEKYYVTMTLEILTNFMTMCLLMYVLMQMMWLPLYGLCLLFVMKTFYVCAIGMIVEIYVSMCLIFSYLKYINFIQY